MDLYRSRKIYVLIGKLVSTINVSLQLVLVYLIWNIPIEITWQISAFIAAYLLTDFLNGLVHMIMDHKESYDSVYGPLVANFHLHHQTPMYTKKPLAVVYFYETGAKIWLVPFLLVILFLIVNTGLNPIALHLLVYIGVLSSVAEVSHYLCHTSDSRIADFLARIGILLSRKHHTPHHEQDNTNYAFLNGASDPLINLIARNFFAGYKTTTDQHFSRYAGGTVAEQR